jgi:hypothetical protein
VATIRAAVKRREGVQAGDAFIRRWCVAEGPDGEGLFVKGVVLPVNPAEIVDALRSVGLGLLLSSKMPA